MIEIPETLFGLPFVCRDMNGAAYEQNGVRVMLKWCGGVCAIDFCWADGSNINGSKWCSSIDRAKAQARQQLAQRGHHVFGGAA